MIDTHCHIHDKNYNYDIDQVIGQSRQNQIQKLICVGTDLASTKQALSLSSTQDLIVASAGLHPHLSASHNLSQINQLISQLKDIITDYSGKSKLVAIGETGLDYFYHQEKAVLNRQKELFLSQIQLAKQLNLPLIFHIRQAFDDFWKIYDHYRLPGVIHSFSDDLAQVKRGLQYPELYFGLNGIMTFTKNSNQLKAAKAIPINRLVLETDAPFLTPNPLRGQPNSPIHLNLIARFLSQLRQEDYDLLIEKTNQNAIQLFNLYPN